MNIVYIFLIAIAVVGVIIVIIAIFKWVKFNHKRAKYVRTLKVGDTVRCIIFGIKTEATILEIDKDEMLVIDRADLQEKLIESNDIIF